MTFYATEAKLATVGLAGKRDEINRTAVEVARLVAAEADALVAGNLSLTWAYDPSDAGSPDRVRALFDAQIDQQIAAGPPDFFIGETFSWLGEALLYVERAGRSGLPVMVTMSFERLRALSLDGLDPAECARRLEQAGAQIVGVNCLNGPSQQLPIAVQMKQAVSCYVAAQPAAFRTSDEAVDFTAYAEFPTALEPLVLTRDEMASYAKDAASAGIDYIGSCCGSVQHHVRAMAEALLKRSSEERPWRSNSGKPMSAYEYYRPQ
jgi:betaine-homocysteine S-methyltransferase